MKCPSALSSFKQITNHAKNKKIVLFLDYDGTLSHIVDNPEHAFMSNAVNVLSIILTYRGLQLLLLL